MQLDSVPAIANKTAVALVSDLGTSTLYLAFNVEKFDPNVAITAIDKIME